MSPSQSAILGVLALAASASAYHGSFTRMSAHHRVAAAKRSDPVSGAAYYGYQNNTANACGTVSKDSDMIVGIGPDYYGDMSVASDKCFQHITVTLTSDPSKSVDVTLTDACKDCGAKGNIYLSTAAFTALSGGSLDAGVLDVTWSFNSDSGSSDSGSSSSDSGSSSDSSSDSDSDSTSAAVVTSTKEAATSTEEAATSTVEASTSKSTEKATSTSTSKKSTATKATSASTSSDGWKLSNKLEGSTFLDFFKYDSGTGDNNGVANYVNGISSGLAYTSNGQVILAVDDAEDVSARNSLRMVSKTTFNAKDQNLFIFDIAQIPAVCGTWPAVWFTGANWPYDGEIDVVEGVSLYNQNIYSIHTGSGCTISQSSVSAMTDVKIVEATGTSCDANADPGACGFSDKSTSTFGPGFNKAGGGVFALEFDTSGIKMWFFQAGSVPSDITNLAPSPSTWGTPRMQVSPDTCSPETYFNDLMMVVDINLGGSFTEGVWSVDGAGGQATSCAKQTGVSTAAEYVRSHGSEFGDAAQFKINGFYIYNQ